MSIFIRAADRDAARLRDEIAEAVREWVTRHGEYVVVPARDPADVDVLVGPLGPLPWKPAWIPVTDMPGDEHAFARWLSTRLCLLTLAFVSEGDRCSVVLYENGHPIDRLPASRPDAARDARWTALLAEGVTLVDLYGAWFPRPPTVDEDGELRDDEETAAQRIAECLALVAETENYMTVSFRSSRGVRMVEGPPAFGALEAIWSDVTVPTTGNVSLRTRALSVGGAGRGVHITVAGDALATGLLRFDRITWEVPNPRGIRHADDPYDAEGPLRTTRPHAVGARPSAVEVMLTEATIPGARVDGAQSWSVRNDRRGGLREHASSVVYVNLVGTSGTEPGRGSLTVTLAPTGARASHVTCEFVVNVARAASDGEDGSRLPR